MNKLTLCLLLSCCFYACRTNSGATEDLIAGSESKVWTFESQTIDGQPAMVLSPWGTPLSIVFEQRVAFDSQRLWSFSPMLLDGYGTWRLLEGGKVLQLGSVRLGTLTLDIKELSVRKMVLRGTDNRRDATIELILASN